MEKSRDKQLLRPFCNDDYDMYSSWWDEPPELKSLPHTGFVYDDKAVCFLAVTDCDFSILTFWYANPKNTAKETHKGMTEVLNACIAAGIYHAKPKVFCYTHNRGITRILERAGFVNYDGHLIGDYSG